MEPTTLFLVIATVAVALAFDAINGFHDAANSIATVVSTRVLSPPVAVAWAAFFNFAAMFVFAPKVADTIAKTVKIIPDDPAFVYVVLAGLIGAIIWDIVTWRWAIPVSSSHALIGGLIGAGVTYAGWGVVRWEKVVMIASFIPLAPIIGVILGFFIMVAVYWIFRRSTPRSVDRTFRVGQLFSAAVYSLGHGGNDAQKTMGVIVALLIAAGALKPDFELSITDLSTIWIILSCHAAMAVGTAFGGWRIVKTMGMRIAKLKPVGGFCAETAGAITLFLSTHLGVPVSTTHTITGAIVGVGSTRGLSAVRWGLAGRIVWAWIFTIPAAGVIAAACFLLIRLAHPGF
jgi:PiT family inorganic phosphate transporter